jgi:hypothetical protein
MNRIDAPTRPRSTRQKTRALDPLRVVNHRPCLLRRPLPTTTCHSVRVPPHPCGCCIFRLPVRTRSSGLRTASLPWDRRKTKRSARKGAAFGRSQTSLSAGLPTALFGPPIGRATRAQHGAQTIMNPQETHRWHFRGALEADQALGFHGRDHCAPLS